MAGITTALNQNAITQHFVKAVKFNDETALRELYKTNYHKIETLILKNNGTYEQAKDIFQDAFIAVWKNIKNNKFKPESNNAVNGYLYTIAKNKWMDYLRSPAYKKRVSYNDTHEIDPLIHASDSTNESADWEEQLSIAMKAFEELGEACKSLLTRFYFEKKSMKEIAIELQLDKASTRNKKYRCMQALRKLVMEMNL